jgi:hypothetical protein
MFTQEQEQSVAEWSVEWEAFAEGIEEGEGVDIDALATRIRGDLDKEIDFPILGDISAGDILQIDPRYDAGGPPQMWVAIEEWEPGIWLVAPFSDFRSPAVRGDLRTAEGVVEVWNGRTVPKQVLKYGIVMGKSSEPTENLKAMFRFCLFGYHHLPAGVPERTGTDIVDEDDPRIEYQSYEADRYSPLQYMVQKWFDTADSGETPMSVLPTSADDRVFSEADEMNFRIYPYADPRNWG